MTESHFGPISPLYRVPQKNLPLVVLFKLDHHISGVITMGGSSSKRRRNIWENAFSDISFYWPQDQESTLGILNFQKKCYRETV